MYAQFIKEIQSVKAELSEKIQKLERINAELTQLGVDSLDVRAAIEGNKHLYNQYIDDEIGLKKAQSQQRSMERKSKKVEAESLGFNAYFDAIDNGSFQPFCQFKSKDMKEAWLKGYYKARDKNGYIGQVIFTA